MLILYMCTGIQDKLIDTVSIINQLNQMRIAAVLLAVLFGPSGDLLPDDEEAAAEAETCPSAKTLCKLTNELCADLLLQ